MLEQKNKQLLATRIEGERAKKVREEARGEELRLQHWNAEVEEDSQ